MKFENEFTVAAPIEEVWATLLDVERVAPCMPGAEVLERSGDNAFKVGIRVKVGPISMVYRGQVEITERDDASHQATMRAKAREARGQGTADASVHMTLAPQDGGTHATLGTNLQLSGRAAAMGRGVIGDVAAKLIETFAGNLAEMLAGPGAEVAEAAAPTATPEPAAPTATPEPAAATATPEPAAPTIVPEPAAPGAAPATAVGDGGAPTAPAQTPAGAGAQAAAEAAAGSSSVPWPPPPPGTEAPTPEASAPPPPPPPHKGAQEPSGGGSLPVGEIAASVIAGRLKNPRTLLAATGGLGLIFGAIGYLIGRSK